MVVLTVLALTLIIILLGGFHMVDVSKLQAAIDALKADRDAAKAQLAEASSQLEAAKEAVAAEDQAQIDALTVATA